MTYNKPLLHITKSYKDGNVLVGFGATDGEDALDIGRMEALLNELLPPAAAVELIPTAASQINKGMTKYDDEILTIPAVQTAVQEELAQAGNGQFTKAISRRLVKDWRKKNMAEEPAYIHCTATLPQADEAAMDIAINGLGSHYVLQINKAAKPVMGR
jgi:hypothetical protein